MALHTRAQVYNIASTKTVPQWLSESKKKSLKRNEEYRRRLELLQDFRFPAACQRLKVTPDQQFIFATGYHPPQVGLLACSGAWRGSIARCGGASGVCSRQDGCRTGLRWVQVKVFDLAQLSLKFDRHLDAEIVDFQVREPLSRCWRRPAPPPPESTQPSVGGP